MRKMSDNKFQLGIFASNIWGGMTKTTAPERWDASWINGLAVAQMAEEAGLEFILPLGQWGSHRGKAETEGYTFETLTWATGILAATSRITVFGTIHPPLLHPVYAAKAMATADHVGAGRFGLNIVSGSNPVEFALFGVELLEHDERYVYTEEWLTLLKRMWSETEPFDHDGKYFHLRGVHSNPSPFGENRPILINAGQSPAGRAFAVAHTDMLFKTISTPDALADEVAQVRAEANDPQFPIVGSANMYCRATRAEAEDYYHYMVHEHGDWLAGENVLKEVYGENQKSLPQEFVKTLTERSVAGAGLYAITGDPDDIAALFKRFSDVGLDGMALVLPNYLNDLPILRDEVLPRLQRLGLRGTRVAA